MNRTHGILSGFFQVPFGLRDHFATTVAHLWANCILFVAFSFPFLPFRLLFPLPKEEKQVRTFLPALAL